MWQSVAVMACWLHDCTPAAALYDKASRLGLTPVLMRLQVINEIADSLRKTGATPANPSNASLWQQKEQVAEQLWEVSSLHACGNR